MGLRRGSGGMMDYDQAAMSVYYQHGSAGCGIARLMGRKSTTLVQYLEPHLNMDYLVCSAAL